MYAAQNLRSPASGFLGQGTRFVCAGATVALLYVAITTLLSSVVGVPFQVALAIGFSVALMLHFTAQRVFVWTHHEEYALPLPHQAARYLPVAAAQFGLTAASTALLPSVLGIPVETVYLATVALLAGASFLMFRYVIFHAHPTVEDPKRVPVVKEDRPRPDP
jgi:putative flippase GtrA